MIEIYWKDLTKEKQAEILEALGDNGNFDVFPIAEIPVPEREEQDLCPCAEENISLDAKIKNAAAKRSVSPEQAPEKANEHAR